MRNLICKNILSLVDEIYFVRLLFLLMLTISIIVFSSILIYSVYGDSIINFKKPPKFDDVSKSFVGLLTPFLTVFISGSNYPRKRKLFILFYLLFKNDKFDSDDKKQIYNI
jgi:hypothetical protein